MESLTTYSSLRRRISRSPTGSEAATPALRVTDEQIARCGVVGKDAYRRNATIAPDAISAMPAVFAIARP